MGRDTTTAVQAGAAGHPAEQAPFALREVCIVSLSRVAIK